MLTQLTIFLYIVIFLYGIVIGSFLNVLIFRIPKKENIVQSSHCMNCGRKLGWRDMVPVFSYIILRGRCRQCGARISIQYPLIEALNGVLYVVVFMAGGFTFSSVLYCLMTSALIVIAVIDERTYQIPVSQNLFLGLLGILMTVYDFRHILSHIIGAVIVSLFLYGLYYFSSGKAIGGGDIKLMAYAGLLLGAKNIILAFILACILGSVIHTIRMKVSKRNNLLALGPYLSAGIFIAALWGSRFWTWYLGMMGIYFPTEVGGAGGDVLSYVMAVEELSKVCGTTGVIVSAHTSLCAAPIYENGTPEQKAKYLPKLCSGEWLGAFGLTEPGAGTDAQGQQTIAKEEDDCWVLNGSKIFITNAGYADVFIVIAVTDHVLDKKGRPTKLCSAFIVERTDPGFSVGKAEDKMGIRGSSTCELIFEDCRIPKDRMLGVRGKGFQLAMATLDGGRIGIASQALGIAEGALEETVAYVKERKQFGRPIAAFQNTQFELAEMKARVEAAKYLVYAAALKKQQAMDGAKVRYSVEAAQAKLIAARTASDVTRRCLQLFGGYGYTRDYPIERMMRDAKITEIYEGTSEVQMMVISGALLK